MIDRNRLKMRPPPNMYQQQISTKICLKSLVIRKYTNKTHNNLLLHGSSAGKESSCKAGDPGSIPRSGRSAGEGIGYPLQFLGLFLWYRQQRICLQCGRPGFDPWVGKILEKGMANPLWYSSLKNPHGQRSLASYSPWDPKELDMTQGLSLLLSYSYQHG